MKVARNSRKKISEKSKLQKLVQKEHQNLPISCFIKLHEFSDSIFSIDQIVIKNKEKLQVRFVFQYSG